MKEKEGRNPHCRDLFIKLLNFTKRFLKLASADCTTLPTTFIDRTELLGAQGPRTERTGSPRLFYAKSQLYT